MTAASIDASLDLSASQPEEACVDHQEAPEETSAKGAASSKKPRAANKPPTKKPKVTGFAEAQRVVTLLGLEQSDQEETAAAREKTEVVREKTSSILAKSVVKKMIKQRMPTVRISEAYLAEVEVRVLQKIRVAITKTRAAKRKTLQGIDYMEM